MKDHKRSGADPRQGTDPENLNQTSGNKDTQLTNKEALKHLKELHLQAQRLKYPSLPYYTSPQFTASKSNDLTRCVQTFLKLKGWHCERTGNEGRIIDDRQTYTDIVGNLRTIGNIKRIKSSGMKGTSDLKAIINGRFVAIEIKQELTRDKQRPDQKRYQAEVEASGGLYVIVTSFAMFVNWYYSNIGELR